VIHLDPSPRFSKEKELGRAQTEKVREKARRSGKTWSRRGTDSCSLRAPRGRAKRSKSGGTLAGGSRGPRDPTAGSKRTPIAAA
jgi:hypothetical protein